MCKTCTRFLQESLDLLVEDKFELGLSLIHPWSYIPENIKIARNDFSV